MTPWKPFALFWVGLVALVVVIALSLPLTLTAVPGGLVDHQTAGTAAEVDRIQAAWRAGGVERQAQVAMLADLVFIVLFGIGSMRGGMALRRESAAFLRVAGTIATGAGAAFLLLDYAETVPQFIQLVRFAGDDTLASLAATVQPPKMIALVTALASVLAGLIGRRIMARRP